MIVYSFQTYPRETLFIQSTSWTNQKRLPVKDTTITNWIIDLVPSKKLGVGTFRSSFVPIGTTKVITEIKRLWKFV